MVWKRDLKHKILAQAVRIRELEEIICPTEGHDWIPIDCDYKEPSQRTYQCSRCKKRVKTFAILGRSNE